MDINEGYYRQALYGNDVRDQKIKRLDAEIEQLREQRDLAVVTSIERAQEIERLREALEDLMAVQNGPPLATYTDDWNAAMKKADAALQQEDSE